MLLNTDYVTPAELTGYVRAALADLPQNQVTLNRYLPNLPVDDLLYRFTRGGAGLLKAAVFRSYDTESPIGTRPGATRVTGELPPISQKVRLDEYTYARNRANPDVIRTSVESDAVNQMRAVSDRLELARGQALDTGAVTLNENGVQATVSFGRAGAHSVTAGTLWSSTSTADPIGDLLAWQDIYVNSNGQPPGVILLTRTVLAYLMTNAKVIAYSTRPASGLGRVPQMAVTEVLQDFGLPPIELVDKKVNVAGTSTPVIPVNRAIFAPLPVDPNAPEATQLGATMFGTTVEADELQIVGEDGPGIVAAVYKDNDPVALWTKAAAIALPVLANPDLSFGATVA